MEDLKKVATLDNEIEARMLESVLKDREIPHVFRSYHDDAYDGIFQASRGWGILLAPPSRHGEILEILDEIRTPPPPQPTET